MPNTSDEEKHLGGLMVLDIADEKGMYCTRMFAELGADVVIIERPGGSKLRKIGPFYRDIPDPERSLYWWYYNSSKKSITLNLETSEGQDIFTKLVSRADILVETPTSESAVGAGLGYEALKEL
ncbi:CoA transferase, partial [Thermodesulfobacteriota bacterium]